MTSAAAASLSRPTPLENAAIPSSLNLTSLLLPLKPPGLFPTSFSTSVSNASSILFTRPDTHRVKHIKRHVYWSLNLPLDSNGLNASVSENDGRQYAQVASRAGRLPKMGNYEEGRILSRSAGKLRCESMQKQTFPKAKSVAERDDVLSKTFDNANDISQFADKVDIQGTLHTNDGTGYAQGSYHNYHQSSSEAAQNDSGKVPAFSSKLEEILSKFKRKPGFHKELNIQKETRHDYIASRNNLDIQYGGINQVQEKNVSFDSRQTIAKSLQIRESARGNGKHPHKKEKSDRNDAIGMFGEGASSKQDTGDGFPNNSYLNNVSFDSRQTAGKSLHNRESIRGNGKHPHKKETNDINDVIGIFGELASSKQDTGEGFPNNSYRNISGSHHLSEIPHSSVEESHVKNRKGSIVSKTRTSGSIGSRSSPSKSSKTGLVGSNARYKRSFNEAPGRNEKKTDNGDGINMIFELGKSSTIVDKSKADVLAQKFVCSTESSDTSDADDKGGSFSIDLGHEYDHESDSTPFSATQQSHPPTLPVSHNEFSKGFPNVSSVDNNANYKNRGIPNVASWHKHSIPDLPFDFQFSYTENPKTPVVRYREVPFSPFGPTTMSRPWTGRAPLKPSKKKLPEFDSFQPPPRGKKGIKFVQDPGPYPEGEAPKLSKTREEIMGEPLTKEEIIDLVEKSHKERRQLNLGRDGLTHNMLELIHCHWKRRRVCRIKCIGVPTVDMDNVCFHVEDKTGGKVIYQTGGVLYLFRGRNYNYKDRPKIPIMLWKPVTPVYPKLIQEAPEGLTEEEAKRLRQLGEKVEPVCKLAKNGVYLTLVEDVRAAFRIDDLVRIDCQGLNPSDYKKIGAKLKDLVPCMLLSFDNEHILMWKGKADDSTSTNRSLSQNAEHESAETSISCDTVKKENFKKSVDFPNNIDLTHEQEENAVGDSSSVVKHPFILETKSASSTIYPTNVERDLDSEQEKSPDGNGWSKKKVIYFEDLWGDALESGMALELRENLDSDSVVKKAAELAASAPVGPIYTERLISKLKIKMEKERKTDDELRIHFGKPKKNLKKRNFLTNRSLKEASIDVPESGGLPVSELASLLARR